MEHGSETPTHRMTELRWIDVRRKDMKEKQVKIEGAQNRRTWRLKTRCADPKNWGKAEYNKKRAVCRLSLVFHAADESSPYVTRSYTYQQVYAAHDSP